MRKLARGYSSSASNALPKTDPSQDNRLALRAMTEAYNQRHKGGKASHVTAEATAPTQLRAPVVAAAGLNTNKKRSGPRVRTIEDSAETSPLRAAVSSLNARRA